MQESFSFHDKDQWKSVNISISWPSSSTKRICWIVYVVWHDMQQVTIVPQDTQNKFWSNFYFIILNTVEISAYGI